MQIVGFPHAVAHMISVTKKHVWDLIYIYIYYSAPIYYKQQVKDNQILTDGFSTIIIISFGQTKIHFIFYEYS